MRTVVRSHEWLRTPTFLNLTDRHLAIALVCQTFLKENHCSNRTSDAISIFYKSYCNCTYSIKCCSLIVCLDMKFAETGIQGLNNGVSKALFTVCH